MSPFKLTRLVLLGDVVTLRAISEDALVGRFEVALEVEARKGEPVIADGVDACLDSRRRGGGVPVGTELSVFIESLLSGAWSEGVDMECVRWSGGEVLSK